MVIYTINDLENITGVKAHTLRIWEKRYNLIVPKRTSNNIRFYTDNDLKKLMNIVLLYNNGFKISKIAKFNKEELHTSVALISEVDKCHENQLDSLTLAMLELNEYKFKHIVSSKIEQKGFEATMNNVILPLLEKYTEMYNTSSVNGSHERFLNCIIKQITLVEIDKAPLINQCGKGTFLIYLPEQDDQELSLLYSHYLIKKAGFRVVNIGSNCHLQDICDAIKIINPGYIYTLIDDTKFTLKIIKQYLKILRRHLNESKFLVSGIEDSIIQGVENIDDRIQCIADLEELKNYLQKELKTLPNYQV